MGFSKIVEGELQQVRRANAQAMRVREHASGLSVGLSDLANRSPRNNPWGFEFDAGSDGLSAAINTPFGPARAVVTVVLADEKVFARYIFEKLVRSDSGDAIYRPVWAVRIDEAGDVYSDDGSVRLFQLDTMDSNDLTAGLVTVALSALYSIAREPGYFANPIEPSS